MLLVRWITTIINHLQAVFQTPLCAHVAHMTPQFGNTVAIDMFTSCINSAAVHDWAGLAVLVRNDAGRLIEGASFRLRTFNSLSAELEAFRLAVNLVTQRGWNFVQFEVDSQVVYKRLNRFPGVCYPVLQHVVEEILINLRLVTYYQILWVSRTWNETADWVDKAVRYRICPVNGVVNVPVQLKSLLC